MYFGSCTFSHLHMHAFCLVTGKSSWLSCRTMWEYPNTHNLWSVTPASPAANILHISASLIPLSQSTLIQENCGIFQDVREHMHKFQKITASVNEPKRSRDKSWDTLSLSFLESSCGIKLERQTEVKSQCEWYLLASAMLSCCEGDLRGLRQQCHPSGYFCISTGRALRARNAKVMGLSSGNTHTDQKIYNLKLLSIKCLLNAFGCGDDLGLTAQTVRDELLAEF